MNPHSDVIETIRAQADDWWTRLHSGNATYDDAHAFKQWLAQSPAHQQAWWELTAAVNTVTPALQEAVLRHPQWRSPPVPSSLRPSRRAFLGGALAAGAAGVLAWRPPLGLWPSVTDFAADFRTGVGEQREIQIGQAVAVQMNTQTRINRRDSDQGPSIALLGGEAEIQVGDAALTVQAGPGQMQAQSAQFNVRYTGPQVTVTCLQGQVRVHAAQALDLQAGQQVAYGPQQTQAVHRADLAQVTAWRNGYLAFVDTPLAQVVDEINRYRPGKILLSGDALGQRAVRMRLAIRDMDLALGMLRGMPGVQVQELVGGIVLLTQA